MEDEQHQRHEEEHDLSLKIINICMLYIRLPVRLHMEIVTTVSD